MGMLTRIGSVLNSAKLQKAQTAGTPQALYAAEADALNDYSIIPIAHIPEGFSRSAIVHDWSMTRWGELRLGDLWIEGAK